MEKDGVRIFQWRTMVSEFFLSSPTTRHSFLSFLVTGKCMIRGNTYCLCMRTRVVIKSYN